MERRELILPSRSVNSKKISTSNNQIDILVLSPVSYYTVVEWKLVLTK